MELPVPCARSKQSRTRCPGAEDVVSKSWKICGTHRCLHQPTLASTYRLHGLVKTALGSDPSGITFVIDSSHRFLNRATSNGKHGPMSGTGPSAGGRAATPPQTITRVEISGNASSSHSERQQDQHFWAACRIGGPGFPSEPDLPTLVDISPAPRKPAAGSRRTTVGSRYKRISASTNPVATLNPADASDSFSTGSQSLVKIREGCSVGVMNNKEED